MPMSAVVQIRREALILGGRRGRWTVIGAPVRKGGRTLVPCRCDCGTERHVRQDLLISGGSGSCGCLSKEQKAEYLRTHARTHGESRTDSAEYRCWVNIRKRCEKRYSTSFKDYGARGIRVCERWQSFENFLADMGRRPSPKHSIERHDSNGDYEPGNCRWATKHEQVRNTRRSVLIEFRGRTLCLGDWAREIGVSSRTLRWRIENWGVERALSVPGNGGRR